MRVSLVVNPHSGRNRRRPPDIDALRRRLPQLGLHLAGETEPGPLAARILEDRPDLLLVSGGDGTLQKLLTALLAVSPSGTSWPEVGVLPGGTANMTAADLGLVARLPDTAGLVELIAALMQRRRRLRTLERPILEIRVERELPVAAMFFGTGAVCDGVDFWAERFHRRGLGGALSQAATVSALLVRLALRGPAGAGLHGHPGELRSDRGERLGGEFLLTLATTLDRLLLGSTPFWNRNGEPLRVTAVSRDAPGLVRNALRVLRGHGQRLPRGGYHSFGTSRIELTGADRYVVDGEFYRVPAGRTIEVRAGRRVRFVRIDD